MHKFLWPLPYFVNELAPMDNFRKLELVTCSQVAAAVQFVHTQGSNFPSTVYIVNFNDCIVKLHMTELSASLSANDLGKWENE